jgi:hypothetical protein
MDPLTKDTIFYIGTVCAILSTIVTGYIALKGMKPKQLLDGSQAAENFQDIIIKMQAEMVDMKAKLEGKQLRMGVEITVEIDKEPLIEVKSVEWISKAAYTPSHTKPQPRKFGRTKP